MDSEYGTGTNVKHPRRNTKADGDIGEVRDPFADSKDEMVNGWHPRIHQVIPVSEGTGAPAKRLKSLSSSSSSASDISSEDFIQVDPKLTKPIMASVNAPSRNHVPPLPIYYKTDLSSDTSSRLSTYDSSQVSGITHESLSQSTSVTESPPIQVMERPSGFDPNRIPPSVFASKSPSPMDWSVASNESLFSIQIGNNSPSKDRVLKLSGEIHKSGELDKSRNSYKPTVTFSPSPVPRRKENDRRKYNLGRDYEGTEKPMTGIPEKISGDQSQKNYPAQEMTFNPHPEGSELRIKTVVLPQKKKHERSCSNCSCGFCCSTWPSCCLCKWPSCAWPSCRCCKLPSCSSCCKWLSCSRPSCSCCKWSSCSCCKWPSCSGCCKPSFSCCKWPSCSGGCKPSCSCCKWPSCNCCNCSSAFCCCWNSQRKRTTEVRHAVMKSSKRWYSCLLCCSSPC